MKGVNHHRNRPLEEAINKSGSQHIELMLCDLGDLESIRSFVAAFRAKYDVLDVLVNNAGVVCIKRELTKDGFEKDLGINHLGHFLLNLLLEPLIAASQGSVVSVASGAYKVGHIHFDDPFLSKVKNR